MATDSSADEYGRILADTLVFSVPERVRRASTTRRVILSLNYDQTHRFEAWFEYRLRGGEIEIGSFKPCPPDAICAANDLGNYDPALGIVTITRGRFGDQLVLVFERIPD